MEDITDAYESAYIMLNLNKTLGAKAGRLLRGVTYHSVLPVLSGISKSIRTGSLHVSPCYRVSEPPLRGYIPILTSYPSWRTTFRRSWMRGLEGLRSSSWVEIASAKSAFEDDFTAALLGDVRQRVYAGHQQSRRAENPLRGNNPDRQNIYGAALGLYNSRIVKLINKKGMLKSSVIIDELPTIYFKGLDNLIATARSNKVAVSGLSGFQPVGA